MSDEMLIFSGLISSFRTPVLSQNCLLIALAASLAIANYRRGIYRYSSRS